SSLKILEPDQVKTSLLTQTAIDKMWESFEDGIIFAAKKNIPFKIVKGSQPNYKIKHKSKEKKGRLILHTKKEKKKFKDIKMYTDLRCKMLQKDQGRMLRNFFDKPFKSIKLDRILENVNGQSVLISDPTEVKRRTQQYFQLQYQNRNTTNEKQQTIVIAKELIKAECNEQLVRFLGTWINTKFNEKLIKSKARTLLYLPALYNAFQEQDGNPDNHWKLHHQAYKARKLNSPDGDFALLKLKQGIILANIDRKFWQDGN
ncbi:29096_t:CDS:2, partial [Gigaspora margarita]